MVPVGQRKSREAPANPAAKPEDTVEKSADKTGGDVAEEKKNKEPEEHKEEKKEHTEEKPVPAVEAKKVTENEFQVRDVCVSVCVIYSWNPFLISYFLPAGKDKPTDFSFGQNQRFLQLQCK